MQQLKKLDFSSQIRLSQMNCKRTEMIWLKLA